MLDFCKTIFATACCLRRYTDQVLHELGISGSLAGTLKFIAGGEEVTAHDIETSFGLTKATVSENLNSLEMDGYIRRESSVKDGRKKIIKLTKKGEELMLKINEALMKNNDKISSLLDEEEKEMLDKALKKIREKLEEERNV